MIRKILKKVMSILVQKALTLFFFIKAIISQFSLFQQKDK